MRDKSFHCASNINVWALLIFATERQCNFQTLHNYTKELSAACMRAGMTMTKQPIYCDYISKANVNIDELFSTIVAKHMDLDIILVVLPGKTPYYGKWWFAHFLVNRMMLKLRFTETTIKCEMLQEMHSRLRIAEIGLSNLIQIYL